MTSYGVHAAHLISSHAETSFPNWVAICFSPGFPGLDFPSKCVRCGSRPHQRVCEVVTPTRSNKDHPARRPAFLHQSARHHPNQHIWWSRGWSCWLRGRRQEPVNTEGCCPRHLHRSKDIPKLSATINLWAAEGLLELLLSCLFTLGSELIMVTSAEPLK